MRERKRGQRSKTNSCREGLHGWGLARGVRGVSLLVVAAVLEQVGVQLLEGLQGCELDWRQLVRV